MNKYCKRCKHLYNIILDYCPHCKNPNTGTFMFGRDVDTSDHIIKTKRGDMWASQW